MVLITEEEMQEANILCIIYYNILVKVDSNSIQGSKEDKRE